MLWALTALPAAATTTAAPRQPTAPDGHFKFIVPPGPCTVSYVTTDPDIPATLGDTTTPTSYSFTAEAGEDWHPSFDFGVDHKGKVGDTVWNDLANPGVQDAGEPGLAGVTVRLYDSTGTTLLATTVTDSQGKYLFQGLPDGTYQVNPDGSTVPIDFALTTANDPDTATVAGGGSDLLSDFGYKYVPPSGQSAYTISGAVWADTNGNGVRDTGEAGIPGVQVALNCGAAGAYVLTTTSAVSGPNWLLGSLPNNTTCTVTVGETTLPSLSYNQTGDPDAASPPACTGATCDATTIAAIVNADDTQQRLRLPAPAVQHQRHGVRGRHERHL